MTDLLTHLNQSWIVELLVRNFLVVMLIASRFIGMLSVAPVFGHSAIPRRIRTFIAIGTAFLVAPMVARETSFEIDNQLSGLDLLGLATSEFIIGFALGIGVAAFLAGLQIGGQIIDRQLGLSFGAVMNPDTQTASVSGQFLYLAGTVTFLSMPPFDGHILLLQGVLESFSSLPVGDAAFTFQDSLELLGVGIQQSLVLAVQVAAPVLATMSLLAMAVGFLNRNSPAFSTVGIGIPLRAAMGVLVLALSLSGIARQVTESIPNLIFALAK